jgi:hypothetical protein
MTNAKFELDEIIQAAELHYKNSLSDIENASTRIEHLRLSALAEEAKGVLDMLSNFALGLVYTHAAAATSTGPTHEE